MREILVGYVVFLFFCVGCFVSVLLVGMGIEEFNFMVVFENKFNEKI